MLLNIIGSAFFFRLDLTADKRFSILPATKALLGSLPETVYLEVYLEGEFPSGFDRLRRSVKETLDEFRIYAGDRLQYRFINPSESADAQQRNATYQSLAKRGLTPTNLYANEDGKRTEKIIFPGAIAAAGGREEPIMLLKGNQASGPQQQLNQSVEGVEYELATGIKKLTQAKRKRIAIISGHGEHVRTELNDLVDAMRRLYEVELVKLPKKINLEGFDAALIVKPDSSFSEPDKYKLDQLLVNGGRLLFFIDPFSIELDSIKPDGSMYLPNELNLDDMLFRYGARVNPDQLLDLNSAYIPMVVGIVGDKPNTTAVPWRFWPIINTFAPHPIVRNMDALVTKFVSSIDTVAAPGIKKTVLASTGTYSRIIPSPIRMSFNEARIEPRQEQYKKKNIPVAVLLEGSFKSLYEGRLAPISEATFGFKAVGRPGAVLVVSDGDLPLNEVNEQRKTITPLGYDRMSGTTFGHKDFIMNTLAYMLDDQGLILARAKEIALRPLDKLKIEKEKSRWQAINLALPLFLLGLFGIVRYAIRSKRWR